MKSMTLIFSVYSVRSKYVLGILQCHNQSQSAISTFSNIHEDIDQTRSGHKHDMFGIVMKQ